MYTLQHYLNEFRSCISTRDGFLSLCAGVLTCLFIMTLFSDQLHLWPFFRRPTILQYSGSIYSDNIVQRDMSEELSAYLPIDVVYTWVNGSDPLLAGQLKEVKDRLEKEKNSTIYNSTISPKANNETKNSTKAANRIIDKNGTCILSHCIPFNVLVMSYRPGLARAIRRREVLKRLDDDMVDKVIETCESSGVCPEAVTLVKMNSVEAVTIALRGNITYNKKNIPAVASFVTSEKVENSIPLTNYYIISAYNTSITRVIEFLSANSSPQDYAIIVNYTLTKQVIIVYKITSDANNLIKESNNSLFTISPARIVWPPLGDIESTESNLGDFSSNRFEDNEELRYSLRSVLKYAPWVRHVYIVTNGQIPYWLDLSHPRVSIISHSQIFLNKSHLPTFSSPAIESHIHRIPGLSKKFLYMNDDVMFGQPVYPDDFYSERSGQKIYLSWAVPNCHEGCPDSWVGDGYCDKQCNNIDCDWDAGDCNKTGSRGGMGVWGQGGYSRYSQDTSKYCSNGCSDSWLGDRYCDSSCFVLKCGFDSGDCGTEEYFRIHKLNISKTNSTQIFKIPSVPSAYFNLSDLFPKKDNWTVLTGSFHSNRTIRSAVYSNKHHILTMTFYIDTIKQENSTLFLTIHQTSNKLMRYNLSMNISWALNDTLGALMFTTPSVDSHESMREHISIGNREYSFMPEDGKISSDDISKFSQDQPFRYEITPQMLESLSTSADIPQNVRNEFKSLTIQFKNDILTEQGLINRFNSLLNTLPNEQVGHIETMLSEMSENSDSTVVLGRKLLTIDHINSQFGDMPYSSTQEEMNGMNGDENPSLTNMETYDQDSNNEHFQSVLHHSRKLLDTFGESLKYVNRKFNKRYGSSSRKVPAHMPHFIDRDVMQELQDAFSQEFDLTSSHQIRHGQDMQYSFAYFYFYMSEKMESIDLREVFDEFDTDQNGLFSVLEQRNLAVQMFSIPLTREDMNDFNQILTDCSLVYNGTTLPRGEPPSYYGENLPLVDINFFAACKELVNHVKKVYSGTSKRKYEIMNEDEIAFKMINENTSRALGHLDWIRKNKRKFICINDNIDHTSDSAHTVKSLIKEFYISLYPIPAPFELSPNYRNRFEYIDEYSRWESQKNTIDVYFKLLIVITLVLIFVLVFYDRLKRKLCRFDCILLKLFIRKQKKTNYLV